MNRRLALPILLAFSATACADGASIDPSSEGETSRMSAGASGRPESAAGEYFVGFRNAPGQSERSLLVSKGAQIHREFPEVKAFAIKTNANTNLGDIASHGSVAYVEAVPMRYASGLSTSQLAPSPNNGLYGLLTTKSTDTHGRSVTGVGIKVGVADTGLDCAHPDIAGNLLVSRSFVGTNGGDGSGCVGASTGVGSDETHATHVAGTIIAANDAQGVYGVAYSAPLLHARVLGPNGGSTSDIMEGVRWLVDNGARVVNLSLGGGLKSRTEENFYKEMRTKGALVVAATGNDGSATRISYPANYPVNIAVGAVDRNNVRASFSNAGKNIDVVAPGVTVLSSVPANTGSEASVGTASSALAAFGLEFAGQTSGTSGTLVDCGLGQAGECPASVAGNVALIQRGTISFADKVTNAQNAGAIAAIIYNNVAGDFTGTLGAAGSWIPAVSVSDLSGSSLLAQVGASATVVNQVSSWDHYDGTSMATPHAAGVVALIWSANPALSAATVESHLFSTCSDLGAAGFDQLYGRGIVNASAAVAKTGK